MKKLNFVLSFVAVIIFLSFTCPAQAHFAWINAQNYTLESGDTIKFNFGWGHAYPFAGFLDKEALTEIRVDGPNGAVVKAGPGAAPMFSGESAVETCGAYIISALRKPGFYTKTKKGGKAASKKNLDHVIKCYHSQMCMKAIVNVGDAPGPADKVLGHPMEIIPLENPGTLAPGQTLKIKILLEGKPYNDMFFATWAGFSTQKDTFAYASKTDRQGVGQIRLDRPGVWMIKANYERAYPDATECDVDSFTATLTFEVK